MRCRCSDGVATFAIDGDGRIIVARRCLGGRRRYDGGGIVLLDVFFLLLTIGRLASCQISFDDFVEVFVLV